MMMKHIRKLANPVIKYIFLPSPFVPINCKHHRYWTGFKTNRQSYWWQVIPCPQLSTTTVRNPQNIKSSLDSLCCKHCCLLPSCPLIRRQPICKTAGDNVRSVSWETTKFINNSTTKSLLSSPADMYGGLARGRFSWTPLLQDYTAKFIWTMNSTTGLQLNRCV
jgi:hypothetical protein